MVSVCIRVKVKVEVWERVKVRVRDHKTIRRVAERTQTISTVVRHVEGRGCDDKGG